MGVLFAHLEEPVPTVTERRPDLRAGIDAVIATALAKEAGDRYSTCRELIEAAGTELQDSEEGHPPSGSHSEEPVALGCTGDDRRVRCGRRGCRCSPNDTG